MREPTIGTAVPALFEALRDRTLLGVYGRLPTVNHRQADRAFDLLKSDPQHPSLHFKKIGALRSVRVGLRYRALATADGDDLIWFWIGSHADYDRLIKET